VEGKTGEVLFLIGVDKRCRKTIQILIKRPTDDKNLFGALQSVYQIGLA
jgi:hypothetical protein